MAEFRGHVETIVPAATDPKITQLGDQLISRAQDLFVGARPELEGDYRRRFYAAYEELHGALQNLGLDR